MRAKSSQKTKNARRGLAASRDDDDARFAFQFEFEFEFEFAWWRTFCVECRWRGEEENRGGGQNLLPIRFLRAEKDGHLIPRTFSILFRGSLKDGVFAQEKEGRWEKNLLKEDDLTNTAWRLAT